MPDVDPAQRAAVRAAFEDRINHRFTDRSLLARALTHRSAAANHNERLEFLGDGILNFVIAAALSRPLTRIAEAARDDKDDAR